MAVRAAAEGLHLPGAFPPLVPLVAAVAPATDLGCNGRDKSGLQSQNTQSLFFPRFFFFFFFFVDREQGDDVDIRPSLRC